MIKSEAIKRCKKKYILADSSKFDKVSQVSFCKDFSTDIITEKSENQEFIGEILKI